MGSDFIEKNLLTLAATSSEAASLITHASFCSNFEVISARDGSPVPVLDGKPLHSRFNPVKEGERLAGEFTGSGMFLAYGLGGAYQLMPLLENREMSGLVIIENDASLVRSILSSMDLTPLFLDRRVSLWISESPASFRDLLLANYIPVLSGDLQSLTLRTRVDRDQEFYQSIAKVVQESISAITDDYTVQTHFGKKWFINTLNNLEASERMTTTLNPVNRVLITAAGPGLESRMNHLKAERQGATLIATDTSLPVLLKNGLTPDLVISIDCQHISYHHFMNGYPREIPLVLDLASPPFLTRLADRCFFFTSDHPFSNYVSRNFRDFPRIDTSGGNVTHAALSLAESLGARKISLYGADFSYPYGKPYARGSYIYPYFFKSVGRESGIESKVMDFVLHNKVLNREIFDGGFRYISKPMIYYRSSLEKKASTMTAEIRNVQAEGVTLNLIKQKSGVSNQNRFMSAGISFQGRRSFLNETAQRIEQIPELKGDINGFLDSLSKQQKEVLLSILPAAAHFRKSCSDPRTALNKARRWTVEVLRRNGDRGE